ncbi:MAG: molybdenum ABC transporter ATP-binding protein [Gammaproteobacteria bacterium]|jgi:molybdate transport system ATP-binding protein|nr:molybdenum ABC transporter ATP-binding protein [Chromatiales bacterium]MCP4926405.1 molybdenum ABC transporter ATP-binding protein [Gammaproteobacteria bacterium]MDP7418492.1 molybdenum ABC transporter ATP-binding protein [Gammaproteobacteria bacterium]MDP7659600.1 molybdenum ABC transporter ATP-binding protein [Gammaproteobacteria bacterium]HJP37666.1 molybdenum ABC transporter ATP-binding protein [Gammaproteobacteria bacterium]
MNTTNHPGNKTGGAVTLRYLLERADFALDVDLTIPMRGITGIFGKSGSGKTALLRCIAGLEKPTIGQFTINGDSWQDTTQKHSKAVHERQIGYVFQEPRLFDHLNVDSNLEYGQSRRHDQKNSLERGQIIDLLGLNGLLRRRPDELSGGEAQRVAIARALLCAPRLVLMDEPLAALDRIRKEEILPFLDRLHAELSVPILYVSHSIEEVSRLCDHLIIIDQGHILDAGDIQSVLVNLDLPLLAGEEAGSVIAGSIADYDEEYDLTHLKFSGGTLIVPGKYGHRESELRLRIRGNDVSLCRNRPNNTSILNIIPVTVDRIQSGHGPYALVRLRAGNDLLTARLTRRSCHEMELKQGDRLLAQIKSVAVRNTPAAD